MARWSWNYKKTIETGTKYCHKCKKIKSIQDFHKCKTCRDGLSIICKSCRKARQDYPKERFTMYKRNAKKCGREFNLPFEIFMTFWQKPCGYCDSPIATIGLDRIDNTKGYELDNLISCCNECNIMKNHFSIEQLGKVAKIITKLQELATSTPHSNPSPS